MRVPPSSRVRAHTHTHTRIARRRRRVSFLCWPQNKITFTHHRHQTNLHARPPRRTSIACARVGLVSSIGGRRLRTLHARMRHTHIHADPHTHTDTAQSGWRFLGIVSVWFHFLFGWIGGWFERIHSRAQRTQLRAHPDVNNIKYS